MNAAPAQNVVGRLVAYYQREDVLDRIPGFKGWKAVVTIMMLLGGGLILVGFLTSSTVKVENFPFNELALRYEKSKAVYGKVWNWIHFFVYYLLTLMFPDCWLLIWILGFVWESYESIGNWHDWNDILFNGMGVAAGYFTAKVLLPLGAKATPMRTTQTKAATAAAAIRATPKKEKVDT
jgi:hypothetical protein